MAQELNQGSTNTENDPVTKTLYKKSFQSNIHSLSGFDAFWQVPSDLALRSKIILNSKWQCSFELDHQVISQMGNVTPVCCNYLLSSLIDLCHTCSYWLTSQCRHESSSNLKTQVQSRALSDLPLKRDKKYNHVLRFKYEPQSTLTSVRFFFNVVPR